MIQVQSNMEKWEFRYKLKWNKPTIYETHHTPHYLTMLHIITSKIITWTLMNVSVYSYG